MQHDPAAARRDDLRVADQRRAGRACRSSSRAPGRSWKPAATMMLNWARATCGMMGRSPDFMNVTLRRLGAAPRTTSRSAGPSSATTSARYYEYIRENDLDADPRADQPAAQPQRLGRLQSGGRHRPARGARDRAGMSCAARACWRRWRPSPTRSRSTRRASAADGSAHSPFALNFAIPCGTPGLQVPLPRELRPGPLAFRPSARLALRGDGLRRLLRRRAGAVGARVPAGRRQPDQRHRLDHALLDAHPRIRARRRTSPNASSFSAWRCS